jgi:predicted permease
VGRSTGDRSLSQKSLVILQISLSVVLLIGAGLVTQTLRKLEDQNFGFETQGRLVMNVDPSLSGYKLEKLYGLYQQLRERLPQIPSVLSVSYSVYSPMSGSNWSEDISFEGRPPGSELNSSWNRVGPHYFETIGTRLLRGRTIGEEDTPTSQRVAVINETFAGKFFPKEDPIGKHFGFGDTHVGNFEIVGVVEDAKYQNARRPAYPTFFLPFLQITQEPYPKFPLVATSQYIGSIELHIGGKPENLEAAVRRTLAEIDPNLIVTDVMSMREQVERNFNQENLIARLTELFGALALILACVGLYGVTAYAVARRTNEIGIRMALGADRKDVVKMVLRGVLLQLGIGLTIGIPVALASSRLIASQLYGVKTDDPAILGLAVLVLAACALGAGLIPARRAASIEPMDALRME